jgi:hypothetical protein
MKYTLLIISIVTFSLSAKSQDFIYSAEQHIVAEIVNSNYEAHYIDINTAIPQAIQYKWELISNTFPANWSYNFCDYDNCAVGIPLSGTMTPISLAEAQNGIYGYLHLNLTVGNNLGQGKVEVYVYDANDYNIGDTVSWDISWTNTAGLSELDDSNFTIYPNPVTEILNIDFDQFTAVAETKILGIDGKVYYSNSKLDWTTSIDMSSFPNGMYFVEIIDMEGVSKIKKILKN